MCIRVHSFPGPAPSRSESTTAWKSVLDGASLSPDRLRLRGHSHRPDLNTEGEIDRFILSRFGDGSTLETIAREIAAKFPEEFSCWQKALTRVGELSVRYGK